VVALRFFDQKSLEEIGAALGIETAAAQKRAGRAVEKLRQYFVQHGASIPAASITAALSAHAIHGAPSGLAAVVAASASLKGATASSSTLTLIKSTLKLMAWTKAKIAMVAGVAVLLTAGTATITIERIQNHSSYPWRVRGFDGRVLENAPPLLAILPSKLPSGAWGYMGNKFMGTGVSAQTVVEAAYNSLRRKTLQTVVTTKLPENRYDYIGSLPSGNEERMQAEVKRKFGVVAKLETMETNVLVLTVKNAHAPGLRPGTGPNNMQSDGPGELSCVNQPLSSVAGFLQDYFHIPVVDNTDNTSRFDFDLKWDEKDRNHHNDDALKQALLDRLGLELVPDTQSIPTLVIAKAR